MRNVQHLFQLIWQRLFGDAFSWGLGYSLCTVYRLRTACMAGVERKGERREKGEQFPFALFFPFPFPFFAPATLPLFSPSPSPYMPLYAFLHLPPLFCASTKATFSILSSLTCLGDSERQQWQVTGNKGRIIFRAWIYKVLIKFIGKSFQWLSPPLFARSSLIIVINFFPLPFPNVLFKGL